VGTMKKKIIQTKTEGGVLRWKVTTVGSSASVSADSTKASEGEKKNINGE